MKIVNIYIDSKKTCIKKSKKQKCIKGYFSKVVFEGGYVIEGVIKKMELREGEKVTATVELETAAGHKARYEEGTARWSSSDESIATVTVNPDNELEAEIVGVDGSDNGAVVITFRADGDPDTDQEREVIVTGDVVVTQGEAVVAEMKFSDAVPA